MRSGCISRIVDARSERREHPGAQPRKARTFSSAAERSPRPPATHGLSVIQRRGCKPSSAALPDSASARRVRRPARRRRSGGCGRRRRSRRRRTRPSRVRGLRARRSASGRRASTRLSATATAMPTAAPASAGQARRPHQRPATSAKAAHEAAAVEVWPLGNDGPSVAATGSSSGRARSTSCLTVSVRSLSPRMTATRNGTTQRLRVRAISTIATTTATTTTVTVSPRYVTSVRPSCVQAARVAVAPLGHAAVDAGEHVGAADDYRQQGERHPAHDDRHQR